MSMLNFKTELSEKTTAAGMIGTTAQLSFEALGNEGKAVNAIAGSVEDGVGEGGGDDHNGGFAGASGGNVLAVEEDRFDFGDVRETRNAVASECGVSDAAVFEFDGFEECATKSLDHSADNLIAEAIGIDDRAAFECFDETDHSNRP